MSANPYVNFNDNSVPNLNDMSKVCKENLGRENTNTGSLLRQESSSAIYDQEIFETDPSASKIIEEIENQQQHSVQLKEMRNNQNQLVQNILKIIESRKNGPAQRGAVAQPDQAIGQIESLVIKLGSSMSSYEQVLQKYTQAFNQDAKEKITELLGQVSKYKNLCRKHYYRADNYKTKHLEHEFEMKDRIDQLEHAMDRINVQANKNEELRFEKQQLAQKYEERMMKIESILNKIQSNDGNRRPSVDFSGSKIKEQSQFMLDNFESFNNATSINHTQYPVQDQLQDPRLHNSLGRIQNFYEKPRVKQTSLKTRNTKLNKSYDECNKVKRKLITPKPASLQSKYKKQQERDSNAEKRKIVKMEIKKLNDLLKKFRSEDEHFGYGRKSSGEWQFNEEILGSEFASLNKNIRSFENISKPKSLEEPSSENSMNRAFVHGENDNDEDEHEPVGNSPIFNNIFRNGELNDTSAFKNEFLEMQGEFSPVSQDQKFAVAANHTLDFDVSFSKEIITEDRVEDFKLDIFNQDEQNIIHPIQRYENNNGQYPQKNSLSDDNMEDKDFSDGKESSSIHNTNNNSFNFSNIFHQMNDSNMNNDNSKNMGHYFNIQSGEQNLKQHFNGAPSPGFSNEKHAKDKNQMIDLSSINLAISDHNPSGQKNALQQKQYYNNKLIKNLKNEKKKNKTQKQMFNQTVNMSDLHDISEIKSVISQNKKNEKNDDFDIGDQISPVNDNNKISNFDQQKKPEMATDVYNFVNISKDDALEIINMLKEDYVTLKLGNGKQIQIPRLNLEVLQNNFPQIHQNIKEHSKMNSNLQLNENIQSWFQQSGIDGASPVQQLSADHNFVLLSSAKNKIKDMKTKSPKQMNQSSFQNTTTYDQNLTNNFNDFGSKKSVDALFIVETSPNNDDFRNNLDQEMKKTDESKMSKNNKKKQSSPKDFNLEEKIMDQLSPIHGENHQNAIFIDDINNSARLKDSSEFSQKLYFNQGDFQQNNKKAEANMNLELSNITSHDHWPPMKNDNFLPDNSNYDQILEMSNNINLNNLASNNKMRQNRTNDNIRENTFNDKDDGFNSFENSYQLLNANNLSGNFSKHSNGLAEMSGFINLNQSQTLGGTYKSKQLRNGKIKKQNTQVENKTTAFQRENDIMNALSNGDDHINRMGFDNALSNISNISMRSDNKDYRQKNRRKKSSITKSKKSKNSNMNIKSQRSSHRLSQRHGIGMNSSMKNSERSKNKNRREINSNYEHQRINMLKRQDEEHFDSNIYDNMQQAIIGVGVNSLQQRMVVCKSSVAQGNRLALEDNQNKTTDQVKSYDYDMKFKSFKSQGMPTKAQSKSIQPKQQVSKMLSNKQSLNQPMIDLAGVHSQNQNIYENMNFNVVQNNLREDLNDNSLLERDETSMVGDSMENMVPRKMNSVQNPSIEKQQSENKKKIDIKNLIKQSKIKRLDNNMKSVKIQQMVNQHQQVQQNIDNPASPQNQFTTPVQIKSKNFNISVIGGKVIKKKKKQEAVVRDQSQNSVEQGSRYYQTGNEGMASSMQPKICLQKLGGQAQIKINKSMINTNSDIQKKSIKTLKNPKIKLTKTTRDHSQSKESQRSTKISKNGTKVSSESKSTRNQDIEQLKKSNLINQLLFKQQQRLNSVKNNKEGKLMTPSMQMQPDSLISGSGGVNHKDMLENHNKIAANKLLVAIQANMQFENENLALRNQQSQNTQKSSVSNANVSVSSANKKNRISRNSSQVSTNKIVLNKAQINLQPTSGTNLSKQTIKQMKLKLKGNDQNANDSTIIKQSNIKKQSSKKLTLNVNRVVQKSNINFKTPQNQDQPVIQQYQSVPTDPEHVQPSAKPQVQVSQKGVLQLRLSKNLQNKRLQSLQQTKSNPSKK